MIILMLPVMYNYIGIFTSFLHSWEQKISNALTSWVKFLIVHICYAHLFYNSRMYDLGIILLKFGHKYCTFQALLILWLYKVKMYMIFSISFFVDTLLCISVVLVWVFNQMMFFIKKSHQNRLIQSIIFLCSSIIPSLKSTVPQKFINKTIPRTKS